MKKTLPAVLFAIAVLLVFGRVEPAFAQRGGHGGGGGFHGGGGGFHGGGRGFHGGGGGFHGGGGGFRGGGAFVGGSGFRSGGAFHSGVGFHGSGAFHGGFHGGFHSSRSSWGGGGGWGGWGRGLGTRFWLGLALLGGILLSVRIRLCSWVGGSLLRPKLLPLLSSSPSSLRAS